MSEESSKSRPMTISFLWIQFGPYLMDRCESVANAIPDSKIIGVEIASKSTSHYAWAPQGDGRSFAKITLFPDDTYDLASRIEKAWIIIRGVIGVKARHNFLCHYNMPVVFLLAIVLRLFGRNVFIMNDSKFDDQSRYLWREIMKWIFLLPYNGALVGGRRHQEYMSFLGFRRRAIAEGFDTVSMTRIRTLANARRASISLPFAKRNFIVLARLIAKKNLPLLIAAYQLYRAKIGDQARDLVILSSGVLQLALESEVHIRGLRGIRFTGFVSDQEMAEYLGDALALILPSIEEQWGVVVNEALFLGIPVLCSENVGARDGLVRNGINGYVFNSDDATGLAHLMVLISSDENHWHDLSAGSLSLAPVGDTKRFADGVRSLIELVP